MKKRSTILIISGAAIAVIISTVALYTHFRLVATEGVEHGNETAQQIANEVVTGQPAHQTNASAGTNWTSSTVNPEDLETPAQRAAEGK